MRGIFNRQHELGQSRGTDGVNVANKSQAIYANYLETDEKGSWRCLRRSRNVPKNYSSDQPKNANAYYWQAYAFGRYAQGIRSPRH